MIPLIDKVRVQRAGDYFCESGFPQIVLLHKGEVCLSVSKEEVLTVPEGHLFLVPGGVRVKLSAQVDSQLILFTLRGGLSLCPSFRLEELVRNAPTRSSTAGGSGIYLLPVNRSVACFLSGLLPFLDSGLRCESYLQIKVSELFFYLRGYYPKEELALFFSSVLDEDSVFRNRVCASLRKDLKVGELPVELGMCYAKLIGRFYQVFGRSPKEFIDAYKKEQLLHELKWGIKPLKTLPMEYGFGSYSAFTRFCVSHLGSSPADIRSKK